jgi:hypothetical protein
MRTDGIKLNNGLLVSPVKDPLLNLVLPALPPELPINFPSDWDQTRPFRKKLIPATRDH